jgi:xanthine dehydrogenase accessory factor
VLSDIVVLIRGGGEMASGVAWRLYQCGFRIILTEKSQPMAVRRKVSFCEAVYEKHMIVEGVEAQLIKTPNDRFSIWAERKIPLMVDPDCESKPTIGPNVLVDAILAKKNVGTTLIDAPLVIALGPGFEVDRDAHFVVETMRGHNLGRLLISGQAEPDTGVPGSVHGITTDRVLRSPRNGPFNSTLAIGDHVKKGDVVGTVGGEPVRAKIDGVLRGLIHDGVDVTEGLKIGDVDPRGIIKDCFTISEKARAIGGAVLEGILRWYGREGNSDGNLD